MNDRFKFRVWSNEYKKFIKDSEYPIGSDYSLVLNQDGELIELGLGDYQDYSDDTHSWATYKKYDNCVIQFCTGLQDKNGKLIYEGDIIQIVHISSTAQVRKYKGKVFYSTKKAAYQIEGYGSFYDDDVFEGIGNVYENPELLSEATNE